MDIDTPLRLLGGLTAQQFMTKHWQKKPLLVRGAIEGFAAPIARSELFRLAGLDDVESRLVVNAAGRWKVSHGPFLRRQLPPLAKPGWTLLVQGADLHHPAAHDLLSRFRFVPDARLDDLMISYASDAGGVGPHFDSYDVFLLQAQGQRRWRYGRQRDLTLRDDTPLKILADFVPEHEHVLDPGDLLYLPPRYAHDGIAIGECQTYSIGFRAPSQAELGRELLLRLADDEEASKETLYADKDQAATVTPGAVPPSLRHFAQQAVRAALRDERALDQVLGEYLTEPKSSVWFASLDDEFDVRGGVRLDRRSRMMYDERHVFINGESWRAAGGDARLMRKLADQRFLSSEDLRRASEEAVELLAAWAEDGWLRSLGTDREGQDDGA